MSVGEVIPWVGGVERHTPVGGVFGEHLAGGTRDCTPLLIDRDRLRGGWLSSSSSSPESAQRLQCSTAADLSRLSGTALPKAWWRVSEGGIAKNALDVALECGLESARCAPQTLHPQIPVCGTFSSTHFARKCLVCARRRQRLTLTAGFRHDGEVVAALRPCAERPVRRGPRECQDSTIGWGGPHRILAARCRLGQGSGGWTSPIV